MFHQKVSKWMMWTNQCNTEDLDLQWILKYNTKSISNNNKKIDILDLIKF